MESFLQSPAWERFQQAAGALTDRHGGQLYIRRPLYGGGYWLSSRCHIARGFSPPPFTRKAVFLRLEPADQASYDALASDSSLVVRPTYSVQPKQSILVDISRSYEDVLKSMKQKHRYNTRLAERGELQTEAFPTYDAEAFGRFWALMEETASRQGFRTHERFYYEKMLEELGREGMATLILVGTPEEDLAGMILLIYQGTATYLHGASSERRRSLMAPYKLHAEAIRLAQAAGCHTYDLWGSNLVQQGDGSWEAPENQEGSGTSRFKLGFGGTVVAYPGAFDLVLRPFWYTLYQSLRRLHSLGRHRAFR